MMVQRNEDCTILNHQLTRSTEMDRQGVRDWPTSSDSEALIRQAIAMRNAHIARAFRSVALRLISPFRRITLAETSQPRPVTSA